MPLINTSNLKCPKCGYRFHYKWLPVAALSSVGLTTRNRLRCPKCKHLSNFNISGTNVLRAGGKTKRYNDIITAVTYMPMIIAFVLLVVFTSVVLKSYTYLAVELVVIEISAMLLTCFSLIFKILPKEEA